MRVYLDTCCLSRLLDISVEDRVFAEARAVQQVVEQVASAAWTWTGSEVLVDEIMARQDSQGRGFLIARLMLVTTWVFLDDATAARGEALANRGFGSFDALHLACAEAASADVFLTTDDRLLKRANRLSTHLRTRVLNPLDLVSEGGMR